MRLLENLETEREGGGKLLAIEERFVQFGGFFILYVVFIFILFPGFVGFQFFL